MHTLHFIVIQADSAADAASDVESEIIQWGNENNWRSIGGVASEDGQDDIENHDGGRWSLSFIDELDDVPKEGTYFQRTLAYVHRLIGNPITFEHQPWSTVDDFKAGLAAVSEQLLTFDCEEGKPHELWSASRNIKQLYELYGARKELASGKDLPDYYSWEFDQTGLTDMTASSEGKQRFIVFLDMHS